MWTYILISTMAGLPIDTIPDDHDEVVALAGLTTKSAIDKLCATISKVELDRYYKQ